MNISDQQNTPSDNPNPFSHLIANLPWEKLVLWAIVLLTLWILRNFLAVIFVTFILSYIAHHSILRLLRHVPSRLAANIWFRRSMVVVIFGIFISALYAASLLFFPAMLRQGDELIATVQNVDPRQKISEVAITYFGEKKLEHFKHEHTEYDAALKAYVHDQAGEFVYTQFISALRTEEAFRQSIMGLAALDASTQLENIEFEEEAFLDYMVDTHFMAQSDWQARFEQAELRHLSAEELTKFRLEPEYATQLHDWLSAHLSPVDLALYIEDPVELAEFEKSLQAKMGIEAYTALHESPEYAAQVKAFFKESNEMKNYPLYETAPTALAEFDRITEQKFQYIDAEYYPFRDSEFYLDNFAAWYAKTTEGNAIFAQYWLAQNKPVTLTITNTEYQRERQKYFHDTHLPTLLRENPTHYKKIRDEFDKDFLPTVSLYGYYFQILSDAYRLDFKQYYTTKHQTEQPTENIPQEMRSAFNQYLIKTFGEKQWGEITSSAQYHKVIENLQGFFNTHLGEITLMIGTAIKNTASFFIQFFISVIFSFIIVLDIPHLQTQLQSLRNTRLRGFYDTIAPGLRTFSDVMGTAFAAQAVIAVCNTILTYVGMQLLKIPLAELMSVFVFICSFIPVLGVFISSIPISLVALQTHGIILMLEAIALITIIHMFEAYLLNPKITGNFLKVHPLLVLMILFVGEHFFGIWGLLLGVPVCVYLFRYAILDMPFPKP